MTSSRCQALIHDNGSTLQCQNPGVFQVHSTDGATFALCYEHLEYLTLRGMLCVKSSSSGSARRRLDTQGE